MTALAASSMPSSAPPDLEAAQCALGAAVATMNRARRAWRAALLDGSRGEQIVARAALGAAEVALERAEARIERLMSGTETEAA